MRPQNLTKKGVVRSKNTYTFAREEEGVFRTAQNKFVVKIKRGNKVVSMCQKNTKEEALEEFKSLRGIEVSKRKNNA